MDNIHRQYQTSNHLNTRISIHDKYSTNKQPFADWIVSHYQIRPGMRILELGCGTGSMWRNHLELLSGGSHLTLTDFSPGMLETARETLAGAQSVTYEVVDIQDIPYSDACYDIVIANMMLYHVPDLHKGLSEVRRVLKPGGAFYCATYGEHGIMEFINETLSHLGISGSIGTAFTLQNGADILFAHFETVQRLDREDGLAITRPEDFVDYIRSLSSLSNIADADPSLLRQALERKITDGVLYVPKEYGMFICR